MRRPSRNPTVLVRGRGKVDVVLDAEFGGMHLGDEGSLGQEEEMNSPLEPLGGPQLCQHLDFSLIRNLEPGALPKCLQIPNSQCHKIMFVVLIVKFWSNLNIAIDNLHCPQIVYEPIKHTNI